MFIYPKKIKQGDLYIVYSRVYISISDQSHNKIPIMTVDQQHNIYNILPIFIGFQMSEIDDLLHSFTRALLPE